MEIHAGLRRVEVDIQDRQIESPDRAVTYRVTTETATHRLKNKFTRTVYLSQNFSYFTSTIPQCQRIVAPASRKPPVQPPVVANLRCRLARTPKSRRPHN